MVTIMAYVCVFMNVRWEYKIQHRKYDKIKPKIYDLMTECSECIEHTKYIGHIGDVLEILDILLYTQQAYLL